MDRELDDIDLQIHTMIVNWADKYHVLMTPRALDELEYELLRPVFEQAALAQKEEGS